MPYYLRSEAINPDCQRSGIIVRCSFLSYGACNNRHASHRNGASGAADTSAFSINLKQKFSYLLRKDKSDGCPVIRYDGSPVDNWSRL